MRRSALIVVAGLAVACSGPGMPSQPAGPSAMTHDGQAKASTASNPPLIGQFRLHPAPDANGTIDVRAGDLVKLNAAHFTHPNQTLELSVNWGDGKQVEQLCGRCRVQHHYSSVGSFTLSVKLQDVDPRTGQVSGSLVRASYGVDVAP